MFGIHKVRLYIMRCLLECGEEGAGFTEMRPAEIRDNLYAYHMKMAVQDGIIEKYRSNYRLTSAGKAYAEGIFQQKKPSPIEVSVLISGDGGEARIISGTAKSDDQHIADAAKRITQEKLRENIPSKPLHIGDAYIKIIGKHEQVIANSFHHFFYVKTGHDLSKVIDDLPNDVKEEVMFVRKNADGHFFFEREYFL